MVTKKAENASHETKVAKKDNPKPRDWLEKLNKNETFVILKQGSSYRIKHRSIAEPLDLPLSVEQATELRNFLKQLEIKNETCIKLSGLKECMLENPEKGLLSQFVFKPNDAFRAKDGAFMRFITTPIINREEIPESIGWATDVAAGEIKNYMNLAMNASHPSPVTVAKQ